MQTVPYKKCKIISTPDHVEDQGKYKYSINGVIEFHIKEYTFNTPVEKLDVPANEWLHFTVEEADSTFVKYAKIWINQNIDTN